MKEVKTFEEIKRKHQSLLKDREEGKEDLLDNARAFVQEIGRAGAQVGTPERRLHLLDILNYWLSYISGQTGELLQVSLEPAILPEDTRVLLSRKMVVTVVLLAFNILGLAGLGYLLLGTVSTLAQNVAIVALGTLLALVGVLEIPTQGEHFRALGQCLYNRVWLRAGVLVLSLATLVLWLTAGRAAYFQIYPCGERVVLVEPFAGRSLEQSPTDEAMGLTAARLRQLFRLTRGLHAMSAADDFTSSQVDFKVAGYYEGKDNLRLVADLTDGLDRPLTGLIEVNGKIGCREDVEALQKELGRQLLAAMGVSPDNAHAALVQAFALHPDALAANQAGVAFYGVGRLAEAQERFREALRIEPDYVEALINLGVLAAAQGRYDEAVAYLQQALALDPKSPHAYYNLGCVYSSQGDWPAAVDAYKQATRRFEGYVAAWNNLGDAYLELGKWRQARAALEKGLALAPDAFYLHKNMGRLALAEGDALTAIAELQKALESNPVYPEAQSYLAEAYALLGTPTVPSTPTSTPTSSPTPEVSTTALLETPTIQPTKTSWPKPEFNITDVPTAMLIEAGDSAKVKQSSGGKTVEPHQLPFPLLAGDVVYAGKKSAQIICYNDRLLSVAANRSLIVSQTACRGGKRMKAGTFEAARTSAGQSPSVERGGIISTGPR